MGNVRGTGFGMPKWQQMARARDVFDAAVRAVQQAAQSLRSGDWYQRIVLSEHMQLRHGQCVQAVSGVQLCQQLQMPQVAFGCAGVGFHEVGAKLFDPLPSGRNSVL